MNKNAIAFAVLALLGCELYAQDSIKPPAKFELQSIVETNNKGVKTEFEQPGSIEIISREDIDKLPYAVNIADVLFYALGVDVRRESPLGDRVKVSMRANSSEQVSILLNGVAVNNTLNNSLTLSLLPVPLSAVQRIEVMRGSQSRKYGNGATGGVINIITRTEIVNKGGTEIGFAGGNNNTYVPEAMLAFKSKLNSTIVAYQGDFRAHDKLAVFKTNVFVDSRFRVVKWFESQILAGLNKTVYTSPSQKYVFDNNSSQQRDDMLNYFVQTNFNFMLGRQFNMWLKLMYNHEHDKMDPFGFRETPLDDPFAIYKLATLKYNNREQYVIDLGGRFTSKLYELDFNISYKSAHLYSNYVEAEILNEWKIVPNEPYSYYKYQASRDVFDISLDNLFHLGALDVSAGLVMSASPDYEELLFAGGGEVSYKFNENIKVYGSGDYSFRSPDFYERFVSTDSIAGKGSLMSEKVTTAELGFKYKNEYSSAGLSAYYQWNQEQIILVWEPNVSMYVYRNADKDKLMKYLGVEIFYEADFEKLTSGKLPISKFRLQYAYNDGDFDGYLLERTHDYLRHKASVLVSSRLFSNMFFDASYTFQSRSGFYAPTHGSAYRNYDFDNILNARLSWREKGWEVYMQGSNLLDEKYFDSSYNRAPGISLLLGAKIKLNFVK